MIREFRRRSGLTQQEAADTLAQALPQAVDSAAQAYERFIDHLRGQIEAAAKEHDQEREHQERELALARRETAELRAEVNRLNMQLWQRGPS